MQHTHSRKVVVIALALIGALSAIGFALTRGSDGARSWKTHADGILAVATPCCSGASLWESLDTERDDGNRPRPANAEEAARWLNEWPHRSRRRSVVDARG